MGCSWSQNPKQKQTCSHPFGGFVLQLALAFITVGPRRALFTGFTGFTGLSGPLLGPMGVVNHTPKDFPQNGR